MFISNRLTMRSMNRLKISCKDVAYILFMLVIYAYGALPSNIFVYLALVSIPILALIAIKYKFHKFTVMNILLIIFIIKYAALTYPQAISLHGGSFNHVFYFGYIVIVFFLIFSIEGINYQSIFLNLLKGFGKLQVIGVVFQCLLPSAYAAFWGGICGPNILSNIVRRQHEGYYTGFTSESATTALWLSAALGITFFSENRKRKSCKCCLVLYLLCLLLTGKRGPFIFAVASVAIVYFIVDRSRLKINSIVKGIGASLAIILLILIAYNFFGANSPVARLTNTFIELSKGASVAEVSSSRNILYERAFDYLKGSIFQGIGWGQYRIMSIGLFNFNGDAHNVYIQVFVENGLIGAIIYIAIITMGLYYAVRNMLYAQKHLMYFFQLCSCLLFLQLYYILYSFSGTCLYEVVFYYTYFMNLMISQSIWNYYIKPLIKKGEI